MIEQQVEQSVKKIVMAQFGVSANEITPETHFVDDLSADSLDLVELMLRLEEVFLVPIQDEEAMKLETVGAVYDYISYGLKLKLQNVKKSVRLKLQRKRLMGE